MIFKSIFVILYICYNYIIRKYFLKSEIWKIFLPNFLSQLFHQVLMIAHNFSQLYPNKIHLNKIIVYTSRFPRTCEIVFRSHKSPRLFISVPREKNIWHSMFSQLNERSYGNKRWIPHAIILTCIYRLRKKEKNCFLLNVTVLLSVSLERDRALHIYICPDEPIHHTLTSFIELFVTKNKRIL